MDITANVEADQKALVDVFGEDAPFQLATKLTPLGPETNIRERGLVLIYSGHGVAVRQGERETTHLCLDNGERLSTDTLFEWIRDQGPLWATVVLNGCETAQVNPAVVSSPPISVISASPSVVTPSSERKAAGTDFVRALVSLLVEAQGMETSLMDANCDGAISDRELFYPLEARLRQLEWTREISTTALPVPKLRRNGGVPLPMFYPRGPGGARPPTNSAIEREECAPLPDATTQVAPRLAEAIASERATIEARRLPKPSKGYFVLNGAADHTSCFQGTATGVVATACKELKTVLQPVPISGLSDAAFREQVTALAMRAVAIEIYWLALNRDWAELHRLRDQAIVGVARTTNVTELLPRDPHRVLMGQVAGDIWRYAGEVPWAELAANGAVAAVCRAPEGQCFRLPPPGTLASPREATRSEAHR